MQATRYPASCAMVNVSLFKQVSMTAQVEVARKQQSALETTVAEATAKLKDLDATLIKSHDQITRDRQTWQTQLRAAQTAEKEARMSAAEAAAKVEALDLRIKSAGATDGK